MNEQAWQDNKEHHQCYNCGCIYRKEIGHACSFPSYVGEIKYKLDIIIKILESK